MIGTLNFWWNGRAPREKVLIGLMLALFAGVVLWLGVYRPVEGGLHQAALDDFEAEQRYADVSHKVALLQKSRDRASAAASTLPAEQIVGQSAGEAGFTLDTVQAQGPDRVDVSIASARSTALLAWIAALEGQGIVVARATIVPSGATGTVTAQIGFRRAGR